MESNKEEAQKCIRIAENALSKENIDQAVKFLNKSIRLYPSDKAKGELSKKLEMYCFLSAGDIVILMVSQLLLSRL